MSDKTQASAKPTEALVTKADTDTRSIDKIFVQLERGEISAERASDLVQPVARARGVVERLASVLVD